MGSKRNQRKHADYGNHYYYDSYDDEYYYDGGGSHGKKDKSGHVMNKDEAKMCRRLMSQTGLTEEELRQHKKYRKMLSEAQDKGEKADPEKAARKKEILDYLEKNFPIGDMYKICGSYYDNGEIVIVTSYSEHGRVYVAILDNKNVNNFCSGRPYEIKRNTFVEPDHLKPYTKRQLLIEFKKNKK